MFYAFLYILFKKSFSTLRRFFTIICNKKDQ